MLRITILWEMYLLMALYRAPNAAKPTAGLPDERSPGSRRQGLSDVDILECSWRSASSPQQRETVLNNEWQSGGQRNTAGIRQQSVLIIDDNDDNLLFAQYAVEHLGYRVTVGKSGHGAVATAMTCLPDIILLDILLEHINGIDVFRQLQKHEAIAHVPVIAVTALARPCDHENIMSAGFSDYLLKPYMIDDLKRMLNKHLSA